MFHVYDYRETPVIGHGFLKVNDVIPRIVDINSTMFLVKCSNAPKNIVISIKLCVVVLAVLPDIQYQTTTFSDMI